MSGVRRQTVSHVQYLNSPNNDLEFANLDKNQRKLSNDEAARRAAEIHCSKTPVVGRMTSLMWEMDSFDPFQIFEVTQKKCHILNVHVTKGTNITKGWFNDLVDTPDPYLILSIPGTPNGKKRTRTIDNCINPTWEETFQFYLDSEDEFQLELALMDANYTLDEEMGKCMISLDDIDLDAEEERVATFDNGSKVYIKIKITEDDKPDIRYSLALSEDEKDFLRNRRMHVMHAMAKLLGENASPHHPKEVPVIGLLGSGGGFRAMTAMSGVCHALQDEGILDCVMYMAGLSGSTWYLSHLYSHPDFPTKTPGELKTELKEAVSKNWVKLLTPAGVVRYSRAIMAKMRKGQPVSFTDLFGHLVGDTLLGPKRKLTTLTDQRRCLVNGAAPLPLYTCLNVKKNVSARVFQDWFEFSPFEVGIAKYGAFMKPEAFGSKFYVGKLLKQFPESPMHFLQGVWGSAFCILFKRLMNDGGGAGNKNKDLAEILREREEVIVNNEMKTLDELQDFVHVGDDDLFESGSSGDEMEDHSSDESSANSSQNASRRGSSASVNSMNDSPITSPTKIDGQGRRKRLQRHNAIRRDAEDSGDDDKSKPKGNNAWKERRNTQKKAKEDKHTTFWQGALDSLFSSSFLDTRAGRAGLVFNPLRGLNMKTTFPISPFSPTTAEDDVDFLGFYEPTELRAKKLYLVDSGLTFNLPFPLLLRPQRAVDLYLSFDFSGRATDDTQPFKEVLLAESWAKLNHVPFPPVSQIVEKYEQEPVREWYLFEDPTDPYCPVILHFIILNKEFKNFKAPGVPRTTKEEIEFANFDIFNDPETPYTIYNFCYTNLQFERMSQLMEFNVRLGVEEIKKQIKTAVRRKHNLLPKPPLPLSEVPALRDKVKNEGMYTKLRKLVKSLSVGNWLPETDEQKMNQSSTSSSSDNDEYFEQEQNHDDDDDDFQDAQ